EKIGALVAGLLGMAWNVMTFFVLPVLVVEGVGPFAAVKRSCAVLKAAWGEALVANFGTGLLMFLFTLVALVPGVLGFFAGGVISTALTSSRSNVKRVSFSSAQAKMASMPRSRPEKAAYKSPLTNRIVDVPPPPVTFMLPLSFFEWII